jgi:hypothetical protein
MQRPKTSPASTVLSDGDLDLLTTGSFGRERIEKAVPGQRMAADPGINEALTFVP